MQQKPAIILLLISITLGLYARTVTCDFVSIDDHQFITDNPIVKQGLSMKGAAWAFSLDPPTGYSPVAWLSHMLDCTVFGADMPGGHHAVSVLLHTANVLLLFILLTRLTGATYRSAAVALLFAVHPLHVESVAWIAERRDVLSMLGCLLTLLTYARYVKSPDVRKYILMALCFVFALLSKPMAVTLPCAMLLLDYWPLKRNLPWRRLVIEKLPLLALSGAASVLTFILQDRIGAVRSVEIQGLTYRLQNAVVGYGAYLWKMVRPIELAAHYSFPAAWPIARVVLSSVVLIIITVIAVRLARTRPYLIVGWFWYLGTMVPVSGLVSVGNQWMADRYTYLPLIGLYIALVWGANDVCIAMKISRRTIITATVIIICSLSILCFRQIGYWRNSIALYDHSLAVEPENPLLLNNLGEVLMKTSRRPEAIIHLRKAIKIQPWHVDAHTNLGQLYIDRGQLDEAVKQLQLAIDLDDQNAIAHFNLGNALRLQNKYDLAIHHYEQALNANPQYIKAHNNLGLLYMMVGRNNDAIHHLSIALESNRNNTELAALLDTLLRAGDGR